MKKRPLGEPFDVMVEFLVQFLDENDGLYSLIGWESFFNDKSVYIIT
jgi:hypothetical protein